MAVSDFCIHTVTFKRPTPSTDSVGGETQTESTLYSSIPACVQPVKAFQQYVYAQQNIRLDVAIYTDRSVSNLSNGDYAYYNLERYVIVGIRNVMNDERVYEVLAYRYTD